LPSTKHGICNRRTSDKFSSLDTLTNTASDSAADRVRNLIFNTLVRKNESFDYVGELAKEITVSPDGLVVTFVLRDNVKFHNGKAFTSADVKYTFDELFKSNSYKSKAFLILSRERETSTSDSSKASVQSNANGNTNSKPAKSQRPKPSRISFHSKRPTR
jgi:ABC-type transport system substrate-binding protein